MSTAKKSHEERFDLIVQVVRGRDEGGGARFVFLTPPCFKRFHRKGPSPLSCRGLKIHILHRCELFHEEGKTVTLGDTSDEDHLLLRLLAALVVKVHHSKTKGEISGPTRLDEQVQQSHGIHAPADAHKQSVSRPDSAPREQRLAHPVRQQQSPRAGRGRSWGS